MKKRRVKKQTRQQKLMWEVLAKDRTLTRAFIAAEDDILRLKHQINADVSGALETALAAVERLKVHADDLCLVMQLVVRESAAITKKFREAISRP